jgi:cell division protein FtsB
MMKPRPTVIKGKEAQQRRVLPTWAAFAIVISISLMLCLSINYRSFSAMHEELAENDQLTVRIQSITDENLQLQDEIHNLKSDARVVQREAQRLGIVKSDKVSVPTN